MPLIYVSQTFYSAGLPAVERYLNEKRLRKTAATEQNEHKYAGFGCLPINLNCLYMRCFL